MKLILKDKTEIELTSVSDNYNAKGFDNEEKRSLMFSIMNPSDELKIDYLAGVLTRDNLSEVQIVAAEEVKKIEPCEVENIIDNISDDAHCLSIRVAYVK